MPRPRAVYTALFGGYEQLGEQPVAHESDVDFICFTDDATARSETWDIVLVEPTFPLDMVRSQRQLKIRGHERLAFAQETLYIDNAVHLKQTPEVILDTWLADGDLALTGHSHRERVIDEFDEVLALNYDDAGRVQEQLLHYASLYPELLGQRPTWNGMIARRHSPDVDRAMVVWFDHVLRYSRRDQLAANVAFALSDAPLVLIDEHNNDAASHAWPVERGRDASRTKANTQKTGPLLAEIARQDRALAALATDLTEVRVAEAEIRRRAEDSAREVDRLERALAELRDTYERTFSWLITKPLRTIRSGLRRR